MKKALIAIYWLLSGCVETIDYQGIYNRSYYDALRAGYTVGQARLYATQIRQQAQYQQQSNDLFWLNAIQQFNRDFDYNLQNNLQRRHEDEILQEQYRRDLNDELERANQHSFQRELLYELRK